MLLGANIVHLNGRQRVFLTMFWYDWLETSTRELKVGSELSYQNPVGTLNEIISILKANFYENINAHF